MPECNFCTLDQNVFARTENFRALIPDKSAALAHSIILSNKHCPIFEQIEDEKVEELGIFASKISGALFELIKAHGTNIFIQNGLSAGQALPHFSTHIIPRFENDKINLEWEPTQISEDEMTKIELLIIKDLEPEDKAPEQAEVVKDVDKEGYMVRRLRRLP